jgi:uncharacterized protein
VKFWDTSALVPLLIEEPASPTLRAIHGDDPAIVAWWGTGIESASAIARREREQKLPVAAATSALERLRLLSRSWYEIQPMDDIRQWAVRLLRVHPLGAADAQQLAAAILASEGRPSTLEFLCLDDRLATAASREGFVIVRI